MYTVRLICIVCFFALLLFLYIQEHHEILSLRMHIPQLEKEIRELNEENLRLEFSLQQFFNPHHLLQLAQDPAYGHLHFVSEEEVIRTSP